MALALQQSYNHGCITKTCNTISHVHIPSNPLGNKDLTFTFTLTFNIIYETLPIAQQQS